MHEYLFINPQVLDVKVDLKIIEKELGKSDRRNGAGKLTGRLTKEKEYQPKEDEIRSQAIFLNTLKAAAGRKRRQLDLTSRHISN